MFFIPSWESEGLHDQLDTDSWYCNKYIEQQNNTQVQQQQNK